MEASPAAPVQPEADTTVLDVVMAEDGASKPFPLNKVVAFAGPYVSVLAGIAATWLTVHVHVLSTFHVSKDQTAKAIIEILIFGITALVTYAGQHHWLNGWQAYESDLRQPMLAAAKLAPLAAGLVHPGGDVFDPAAAKAELDRKIAAGEVPAPPPPAA